MHWMPAQLVPGGEKNPIKKDLSGPNWRNCQFDFVVVYYIVNLSRHEITKPRLERTERGIGDIWHKCKLLCCGYKAGLWRLPTFWPCQEPHETVTATGTPFDKSNIAPSYF